MPRRPKDRPVEKVTLYLFKGDFAKLKRLYPRIGASEPIRLLVAKLLRDKQPELGIDPEDL